MNKIYSVSAKELKFLKNNSDYIFVNFDYDFSIKIGYHYDEIEKKEKNKLLQLFNQLTGIDIRTDDMLGKLNIILLKLLLENEKDNIIISNVGFSIESFQFLIKNIKKIFQNVERVDDKSIIILECNPDNPDDNKHLNHFLKTLIYSS